MSYRDRTPDEIEIEIEVRRSEIARQLEAIENLKAQRRNALIAIHGVEYVLEGERAARQ